MWTARIPEPHIAYLLESYPSTEGLSGAVRLFLKRRLPVAQGKPRELRGGPSRHAIRLDSEAWNRLVDLGIKFDGALPTEALVKTIEARGKRQGFTFVVERSKGGKPPTW